MKQKELSCHKVLLRNRVDVVFVDCVTLTASFAVPNLMLAFDSICFDFTDCVSDHLKSFS